MDEFSGRRMVSTPSETPTAAAALLSEKGGMNTKLHAVTDEKGRPVRFFMSAGETSDYTGAAAFLSNLPSVL